MIGAVRGALGVGIVNELVTIPDSDNLAVIPLEKEKFSLEMAWREENTNTGENGAKELGVEFYLNTPAKKIVAVLASAYSYSVAYWVMAALGIVAVLILLPVKDGFTKKYGYAGGFWNFMCRNIHKLPLLEIQRGNLLFYWNPIW